MKKPNKPGAKCSNCGKPLFDPVSIELGIGPICRVLQKLNSRMERQQNLFDTRAQYSWGIDGSILWIKDLNGDGRSVTNDAENVLTEIAGELSLQWRYLTEFLVMYKDSQGVWDQLVINKIGTIKDLDTALQFLARPGQYFSKYVNFEFRFIGETEYQAAKEKLLSTCNIAA